MSLLEYVRSQKSSISNIANRYGVEKIFIFGSVVRGDETADSDIDFLVRFQNDRTLFDLIAFADGLESLLQRKVDVITEDSLSRFIGPKIKSEAVEL